MKENIYNVMLHKENRLQDFTQIEKHLAKAYTIIIMGDNISIFAIFSVF
jgi:hypothetical protein